MRLFPFDNFTLRTELPLREAIEQLNKNIVITRYLDSRNTSKPFAGHFDDNRFKVIRTGIYGSTKPVFEGALFSDLEGTKIEMKISINKTFKVVFYTLLGLIGIFIIIAIISGNRAMILGSFLAFAIHLGMMKIFIILGYDSEYYMGLTEIREILNCKN